MTQLALPLSRTSDPRTSRTAAVRAARSGYPAKILQALASQDLSTRELCVLLAPNRPESWPTISSACSRLFHCDGLTEPTGETRQDCQVWTLVSPVTVNVTGGVL